MKKYLKNSNIIFFIIILLMALTCGSIYAKLNINNELLTNNFLETSNFITINSFLISIGIISLSILFSFIGVGVLLGLFYLIYQWFTLGFIITLLISKFGIEGLICGILYFIIYKLLISILLISIIIKLAKLFKNLICVYAYKNKINNSWFLSNIKKLIIIFIVFIIYSLILLVLNKLIMSLLISIL